ncbi:calcium-binding protein [Sphingopyxis sp.]|uniref:calcium-binding protein n=1 Tax=Sphingopyxis sp. TaxID=1908224 RepID=UPI003BA86312
MLKQALLIGAAAISFPALAQNTPPADTTAPPATEQVDPSTIAPAPAPAEPATSEPATAATSATAPTESAQPAPTSAGAATPAQIAQIVDHEFGTYDADKSNDLNETEFAAWMKKLRTATDPTIDPESEQVKSWVGQAWAAADGDKSGKVSKVELTGFLSRGA